VTVDVDIPAGLQERVVHHVPDPGGEDGASWLDRLPRLVRGLLEDWALTPDGPSRHGHCALVLPVRREDGTRAALKVTWPHHEAAAEHLALRAWAGRRVVRLLAADPARWALLLERLDPDTDLDSADVRTTCRVVGTLVAELDAPALARTPRLSDHLTELAEDCARALAAPGSPAFPRRHLDQARVLARELAAEPGGDDHLVHSDLHGGNVLRRLRDDPLATGGEEDWVVIDPKPMAAHPAFALTPLLWNRWDEAVTADDTRRHLRRRLAVACRAAGLDEDLVTAYSRLRMVRNALWALAAGGPHAADEVTTALTVLHALEPA
jgi:streptomycin 6-kinase